MMIDYAMAGRLAVGAAAVAVGTAASHSLVKNAFVYGFELPPSELVAETSTVVIERTRPDYHRLVHLGSLALGLGMAGAAGVLNQRAATPLLQAAVYGLAGLGLGVITGTTGAASLFQGTTVRKTMPIDEGGFEFGDEVLEAPGSSDEAVTPDPGAAPMTPADL